MTHLRSSQIDARNLKKATPSLASSLSAAAGTLPDLPEAPPVCTSWLALPIIALSTILYPSSVVWTRDNQTPWNDVQQNENTKLLTVNQHFEKE